MLLAANPFLWFWAGDAVKGKGFARLRCAAPPLTAADG